jgi:hypothetical protein
MPLRAGAWVREAAAPAPLTRVNTPLVANRLGFVLDFRHNRLMSLSRRTLRPIAWLVAACLLFAQTAAVAFACSRGEAMLVAEAAATTPCAAHLADDPAVADGNGLLAQGNVCEVHCQTASLPDGGAFDLPSIVVVARWEIPASAAATDPAAPASEIEARSAAPPLLALLSRLLI